MKRFHTTILALMLCFSLFLSACTGGEKPETSVSQEGNSETNAGTDMPPDQSLSDAVVDGGVLTIGILADPISLNPMLIKGDATGLWFAHMCYPSLLSLNEDSSTVPYLASSFEVSPDGKTVTFVLREDLKWSDGVPFTSKDVAYSYHLGGEEGLNVVLATPLSLVESVETPDELTVIFNLKQSSYTFVNSVGAFLSIVPEHAWSDIEDIATFANDKDQVVLGPYALKEYKAGEYYIFDRWAENWFDAPDGNVHIKELVYRVYPDMNAMALALEAGEIDINGKSLPADLANQLTEKGFSVAKNSSIGFNHIAFNLENKFLASKTLRRAIATAIDKESVLQFTYKGDGDVMDSIQAPIFAEYRSSDPAAKYPNYDLDQAELLLKEAGYEDTDGDGIINDPDTGENVSFRILVNNTSNALVNGCEVVFSNISDLGIDVILDSVNDSAYAEKYFGFDFDAAYASWGTMVGTEGHFVVNYDADSPVYFNRVKLDNIQSAVDAMNYAASDDELRLALYDFEIAMADEVIDIPLFTYNTNYVYSHRVENVVAYPSELNGSVSIRSIVRMQIVE